MCTATRSQCDRLYLYLYGELDAPEAAEFEEHVRNCPACRGELARARRLKRILAKPFYAIERSDVEEAAADATAEFIQTRGRAQRRALIFEMVAIAAGVLVVLSLYGLFFRNEKAPQPDETPLIVNLLAWESPDAEQLATLTAELHEYVYTKTSTPETKAIQKHAIAERLQKHRVELTCVTDIEWDKW